MDDREIDLARLQALKDLAVAAFQARVSKWESVQAAALALVGLGLLGHFGGQVTTGGLVAITAVSAGAIVLAHLALEWYERLAQQAIGRITREMERLKRRGDR